MENQYRKWVNLSYFVVVALIGYIIYAAGSHIAGAFDLEARVRDFDLYLRILSVAVAALLFFLLSRNEQANTYMNEVMVELSRVTWPTQKETTSATIVVIVMVVVSGVLLGVLDYVVVTALKGIL